jgi:hypothetical protein
MIVYAEGCYACMYEFGEIDQPYDDHVHEGLVLQELGEGEWPT